MIKKYLLSTAFIFFACTLMTFASVTQILGTSPVVVGTTNTYTMDNGVVYALGNWDVIGGTAANPRTVGTKYYIDITWTAVGSEKITFYNNEAVIATKTVSVTPICATPPVPNATLIVSTNTCGNKSLTYTGTPPAGVTWYWQTSASGTSTANQSFLSVSTSGTYYLNALTTCGTTNYWSSSISITATVNPIPAAPAIPSVTTNVCNPKTLTKAGTILTGVSWFWQGTNSSGQDYTSAIATAATYSAAINSTNTYYIAARNNTTGCWSSAAGVSVFVDEPPAPVTPSPYSYCEMDAMSMLPGLPFLNSNFYSYIWYNSANQVVSTTKSYTPTDLSVGTYSFTIKSQDAGVDNNGCISSGGAVVTLNVTSCDTYLNTTETTMYGAAGANGTQSPIGASKTYRDGYGNLLQSQSKSFSTNQVFAAQSIFDNRGQQTLSTLPAPINSSTFAYRYRFATNTANKRYTSSDFDTATKIDAPTAVGNGGQGSLGWYYSSANTLEPNTPVTNYPYSRSWSEDGPNPLKSRSAGPGDAYRMGNLHESMSEKQNILTGELDHYFQLRPQFVTLPNVYSPNLLSGVSTTSLSGFTPVNSTLSMTGTNVKIISSTVNSTTSSGIYPIGGSIPVTAGKKYTFYVRGYKNVTNAVNLYVTSSTGSVIVQTGAALPAIGDMVSTSFVVPAGVTAIKVGVMWSQRNLNDIFYISDVQLRAEVPAAIGYKYVSTDADGKKAATFVDYEGKTLATALITSTNATTPVTYGYDNWSYYYYDNIGLLLASIPPNGVAIGNVTPPGFVTLYTYDYLGRVIETTSPDEGTSRFIYSTDGKLRFSQSNEQRIASPSRFSYTNYDNKDRLMESGEYTSNGTSAYVFEPSTVTTPATNSVLGLVDDIGYVNLTKKNAAQSANCSDYSFVEYDVQTDFVSDTNHPSQTNLFGNVARTENANAITWYSYDEGGVVRWTKQTIVGLDTKFIDYTYDYMGNVTQVAYTGTGATDKFYHHYTYDIDQRLTQVATSTDGATKTVRANYYYYLHGPLKRIELMNGTTKVQGIDYVYTINGALKSINHADPAKDPGGEGSGDIFGMTLQYNDTDYQGAGYSAGLQTIAGTTNQFGGNVKSISWHSPADNNKQKNTYAFTYDNVNQLSNALFGSMSGTSGSYGFTPATAEANRESVTLYDKNGNIKSLVRKGKTGNSLANYSYDYETNTNRLDKVNDNGSVLVDYTYNTIGQMITQVETGKTMKVSYNAYGLVKEVKDGSDKLMESYFYDDHGDLIHKILYNAGVIARHTYYVHDMSANIMSVYEQDVAGGGTLKQTEVPVYGSGRIALYKPMVSTYFYEVTDHLGNVRGVIGLSAVDNLTATMESEVTEEPPFKGIAARRVPFNPLGNQAGNEAVRLNNANPAGPGIALKVSPGDVIDQVSVKAYYQGDNSNQPLANSTIVAAIASVFTQGITSSTDIAKITSGINGGFAGFSWNLGPGTDTDPDNPPVAPPHAYLMYQVFDDNMVYQYGGYIPVDETANMAWGTVSLSPINIDHPGFVYLYVFDSDDSQNWVYFDNLTYRQTHSTIVAGADYYPFGLAMDNREIKTESYRFGYQGQFSEKDLTTGWNEFELRNYDARFGRWVSPDPDGQYASPYLAMGNAPNMTYDVDGGFALECPPICPETVIGTATANASLLDNAAGISLKTLNEVVVTAKAVTMERVLPALTRIYTFGGGIANAVNSDFTLGAVSLRAPSSTLYGDDLRHGQQLGHYISFAGGAVEEFFGISAVVSGGVVSATGAGAVVGAPAMVGGAALSVHAGGVMATSLKNMKVHQLNMSSGGSGSSSFSPKTLDDGANLTMTQKGTHIFSGKLHPKPYLDQLANAMGGRLKLIRAALESANGKFPTNGQFELSVKIGETNLTIRGFVNNGIPIINTMF